MRKLVCFCPLLFLLLLDCQTYGSAIDLMEAYRIANAEALKWNESAKTYFITSVDDTLESEKVKGEDGKRCYWNFDFVIEGTDKHLIITLHDKNVVNIIEAQSVVKPEYSINMDKLRISSSEAVAAAKALYGLLPGKTWAQGYHFVMENDGVMQLLSVVGLDQNGSMTRIVFNAETGQVIN